MLIVPDFVRILIVAYWDAVLNWLSAAIYADLVKHAADHFLVALQTTLDFAPQDTVCAAFHHADDPGAPPTHPVPQLVRVLLISYCFNWSLHQLEFQIRFNLPLKWFAGYPLFAVGPDHSTPDRFEQWVIAHQHRTLFDEVLRQIDRDFPDQRHQPQIGDTFALSAHAAKESLVELLRHTAPLLLHDLEAAAPESHRRSSPALALVLQVSGVVRGNLRPCSYLSTCYARRRCLCSLTLTIFEQNVETPVHLSEHFDKIHTAHVYQTDSPSNIAQTIID